MKIYAEAKESCEDLTYSTYIEVEAEAGLGL